MKTWGKFCPKLLSVSAKGKGAVWAVSGGRHRHHEASAMPELLLGTGTPEEGP